MVILEPLAMQLATLPIQWSMASALFIYHHSHVLKIGLVVKKYGHLQSNHVLSTQI